MKFLGTVFSRRFQHANGTSKDVPGASLFTFTMKTMQVSGKLSGICKARTAYEYELYVARLDEICKCNRVTRYWNWWKVWRYHLVPAMHGCGWTGTNWAEIGQSCMKPHNRIWLLDAMWEDILHAIVEEADWLNFTKNKGKVLG